MIRKYFKDAGLLALAGGILQLRGLVLIPFLTRQFGAVNYGVWSQIAVLISTITPLIILGTDSAVLRLLPGIESSKQKHYFSAWIIFLLATATIFALPLLLFNEAIAHVFFGSSGEYVLFLPLAALWLIVGTMLNATQGWFRLRNNARSFALSNMLRSLFNVVAVATMLTLRQGVYQLVLYSTLADVVLFGLCVIVIQTEHAWTKPDFSILRPMLKYGLPLVPGGFAIWGLNYIDRLFLVQFSNLQELGIYSLAYSLAYQIVPLLIRPWNTMFANSAAELHNREDHATLQHLFERAAGLTLAIGLPACIGLFLLGKRLFILFATQEFIPGVPVLFFISISYLTLHLSSYYEIGLGLVYKQFLSTWFYFAALIVNVGLNFLLIPRYSILGAAVATGISFVSLLLLSMYYANKNGLMKTDFGFIRKIVVASIIMGLGTYLIDIYLIEQLHKTLIELLFLAGIGTAIYLFFLWAAGVVNKREFRSALSLLRH